MQEIITDQQSENGLNIYEFTLDDKQRLVDAFVWLIQEDKKQNPERYKFKKVLQND